MDKVSLNGGWGRWIQGQVVKHQSTNTSLPIHPIHEVVSIDAECAKCQWPIWTTPSSGVPSHNGSTRTNQTHIRIYIAVALQSLLYSLPNTYSYSDSVSFFSSSRFPRRTGSGGLMVRWCNPLFPLLYLKWNWDWYYVVTGPDLLISFPFILSIWLWCVEMPAKQPLVPKNNGAFSIPSTLLYLKSTYW